MPAGKIPLALHRVQEDGITRCGEAIGLDRLQRLGRCGHRRLFVHPLWRADKSIWLRAIVLTSVMWPSLVGRNGSAKRDIENRRAATDYLGGHVLTSGVQEFRTGGVGAGRRREQGCRSSLQATFGLGLATTAVAKQYDHLVREFPDIRDVHRWGTLNFQLEYRLRILNPDYTTSEIESIRGFEERLA